MRRQFYCFKSFRLWDVVIAALGNKQTLQKGRNIIQASSNEFFQSLLTNKFFIFNGVVQLVFLTLKRWLVAGVYKAIGRHMKRAEPSLSSAPRPNLYPGFPSEDQKATWLASQAAAPQGKATQAPSATLGMDLPDKENASQTTQEKEGGTFEQRNPKVWH